MEDLTGKQLGKYRVVGALGEGGMAAVYKAYQADMDRYVALKILPRHFASDPEFAGRFEQEAKLIAKLQHVHILPVHDFGEEDVYTYIVMPYVETGTLDDLLHGEPLPLEQIRKIIKQVGEALSYAHSRGLVHRDIKPSNILIDEQGNCLLTDFGIAKIVEGTAKFTRTGAIIGTPEYMSPEQILGEKSDGRSDIYSLGIVLYELATGRPPFRAETPPAVFVKHLHDPLPPPRTWNPNLPEAVEKVILKALAREPGDRFATATELVQALEKALSPEAQAKTQARVREQAFIPTVVEAPPIAGPKPGIPVRAEAEVRPKRKLPWWVIALGALGLGGIGLVLILGVAYLGPLLFGGEGTTTPEHTMSVRASSQTASRATAIPQPSEPPSPAPIGEWQFKQVEVKWTYSFPAPIWSLDAYGDGFGTGDLNGDGVQDVAFGTKDGHVVVLNGANGEEIWKDRITMEASEPINVDLFDVNDDGNLEIIAAGKGDSSSQRLGVVVVFDRNGSKLWQVRSDYDEVVDLAYGDIDADGDTDVVASAGTYAWGGGQVLLYDGKTGLKIWSRDLGRGNARGIDAGDVDGDGDMEVAVENYDNKVFLLDGRSGEILWSQSKEWYGRDVVIADVDGDGTPEILSGSSKVSAFDPKGNLKWKADSQEEATCLSVADINGDGRQEVIFNSAFSGISLVLDDAGRTLWQRERSGAHAVGDVDGNGVEDIVFATIRYREISPPYAVEAVDGSGNVLWSYPLDSIFNEGGFNLVTVNLDDDPADEVVVANGRELFVLDPSS
jgi:outer membrane protein assembly factor BamB/predicted Ser/Thr protein kinase